MTKHARLSPSKWALWMKCPGGIPFAEANAERLAKLAEGKPTSSPAAAAGTVAHEYGENMIVSMNHSDEDVRAEHAEKALVIRRNMEPALIDNAESYVAWANGFLFERPNIPWGVELSASLWYEPTSRGTADFWAVDTETLIVVDYKSGRLKVEAVDCLQIAIYLIAIYDEIKEYNPQIKKFRAGVMQPFCSPKGRNEPIWWDFDMGELDRLRSIINAGVKEVHHPIAGQRRLVASQAACRFCPAKTICPAQEQKLNEFIGSIETEPAALDGELLFDIYNNLPEYRSFLTSIEDYVRDQSDETLVEKGFLRKEGSKRRSWNIPEAEVEAQMVEAGIEPFVEKLKTPAQVEKELGALREFESIVVIDFNKPKIIRTKEGETTFKVSR